METLNKDFKRYGTKGLILLAGMAVIATAMIVKAAAEVYAAGSRSVLGLAILALILALTSARHPIKFSGNHSSVSISEALTYLAIMALGPYHGALLAAFEALMSSRRLKTSLSLYIFNGSAQAISIYVAGQAYYLASVYLLSKDVASGLDRQMLMFVVPLITLALVHYILNVVAIMLMSHIAFGARLATLFRDIQLWEPLTFLAAATVAGLINFTLYDYGYITTLVVLVLAMPVPIIVYYTFKTNQAKLREQAEHHHEITGIYDSILEMLAMAIDAKDDVTHDHIQRVKLFACRLGEVAGLSELEIEALKAGALLHDIGKIGVPAYILNKPGKLTKHEFEQMKMHTIIGADMLSNINFRFPVVPIVRHHHERWDGRGYPDGLKGEDIPKTARILTLVDNYDALRSDRPYHRAMTRDEALDYIGHNAGTFFDPALVQMFLSIVDQLEKEAAGMKWREATKKGETGSRQMADAAPASGFAAAPEFDRARAAINSIAETNQRVSALYEMSRTLAGVLPVEDTIAILANRLMKLIPFTTCAISLFDPARSEFEIAHAVGLHAEKLIKRRQPAEAGITGWVITNQRAMFNTNPALDLGFLGADVAKNYKGLMVFPLVKNEESLGAIALYSTELETYQTEDINLMESVCQPASDAVYNAKAFEQAQAFALTDPATGLANIRALMAQFDRERARSLRLGTHISLLEISFPAEGKAVSESDQITAALAGLIARQVRQADMVARQTDGTFIVLLPDSDQGEAIEVRDRIAQTINQSPVCGHLQIQIGVAISPEDGTSIESLLRAARMDSIAGRETLGFASAAMGRLLTSK